MNTILKTILITISISGTAYGMNLTGLPKKVKNAAVDALNKAEKNHSEAAIATLLARISLAIEKNANATSQLVVAQHAKAQGKTDKYVEQVKKAAMAPRRGSNPTTSQQQAATLAINIEREKADAAQEATKASEAYAKWCAKEFARLQQELTLITKRYEKEKNSAVASMWLGQAEGIMKQLKKLDEDVHQRSALSKLSQQELQQYLKNIEEYQATLYRFAQEDAELESQERAALLTHFASGDNQAGSSETETF